MMKWKSVCKRIIEKVFYFTQNSLVKVALEIKKEEEVLPKAYQQLGYSRGAFRTLSNI